MAKEKFKVGQTVVVLGPPEGWDDDICHWNGEMDKYIGKSYIIEDVWPGNDRVRLELPDGDTYLWVWHRDWIAPIAEYTLF